MKRLRIVRPAEKSLLLLHEMAPKRKAATGASEPPKKAKKQKRDSNVSTASSTSAKHPFKTALKAKLREIARSASFVALSTRGDRLNYTKGNSRDY